MSNTVTYDDEQIHIEITRSLERNLEMTITKKVKSADLIGEDETMKLKGQAAVSLRNFIIQNI